MILQIKVTGVTDANSRTCNHYNFEGSDLAVLTSNIHGAVDMTECCRVEEITFATLNERQFSMNSVRGNEEEEEAAFHHFDWMSCEAQTLFHTIAAIQFRIFRILHFESFPLLLLQTVLEHHSQDEECQIMFWDEGITFDTRMNASASLSAATIPFCGSLFVNFGNDEWVGRKEDCFEKTSLSHPDTALKRLELYGWRWGNLHDKRGSSYVQNCQQWLEKIGRRLQVKSLGISSNLPSTLFIPFLQTALQPQSDGSVSILEELNLHVLYSIVWLEVPAIQKGLQVNPTLKKLSLVSETSLRSKTMDTLESILWTNHSITNVKCLIYFDPNERLEKLFSPTIQLCLAMNHDNKHKLLSRTDKECITCHEWIGLLDSCNNLSLPDDYKGFFSNEAYDFDKDALKLSCIFQVVRQNTNCYLPLFKT